MNNNFNALEVKLKELEEQMNQQRDYYLKLTKEAETVLSNVKTLDGAVQGVKLSIQLLQDGQKNDDQNVQTITEVV